MDPYGVCDSRQVIIIGKQGALRKVLSCTARKGGYVVELEGITHIEQVECIRGENLFITREQLGDLDEDEYYWTDLLGMKVVDMQGIELGEVVNIFSTGSNDVFVVDKDKQYYIPSTKDVVREILVEDGRIVVDTSLLEDLLE